MVLIGFETASDGWRPISRGGGGGSSGAAGSAGNYANIDDFSFQGITTDFSVAAAAAMSYAQSAGLAGVYFPGRGENAAYEMGRFDPDEEYCWLIEGVSNLCVKGDPGSTFLRMKAADYEDHDCHLVWLRDGSGITFDGVTFDGNKPNLTDPNEQTHCVRVGNPDDTEGFVERVTFINCKFIRAFGDGVQIVGAADYDDGAYVADLLFEACRFENNGRSGMGVQRVVSGLKCMGCYFVGGPLQTDQLLDYEPTGLASAAPRRNMFIGCHFESWTDTAAATFFGISNTAMPDLYVAFCHFAAADIDGAGTLAPGGHVLLQDVDGATFVGCTIRSNQDTAIGVLDANSTTKRVKLIGCTLERLPGALAGTVLHADFTPNDDGFAEDWVVENCDLIQHTDSPVVQVEAAHRFRFKNTRVHNHSGEAIKGIVYESLERDCTDWFVDGCDFFGNAGANGGSFTNAIEFQADTEDVSDFGASLCTFQDVTNQVAFVTSLGGVFTSIPRCIGNKGDGADFSGLASVTAAMIGGNNGIADYTYNGSADPTFSATNGSRAIRRDTGRNFIRESGSWVGK